MKLKMTENEIREVLEKHMTWLESVENDGERANLSGADLSGIDLSGCVLHKAYMKGSDLSNADLRYTKMNIVDLTEANLSGADFREANLNGALFINTVFNDTNLSYANLNGALFMNINLSKANLEYAKLAGVQMKNVNLNLANLHEADLQFASLSGVNLNGANLSGANLKYADLSEADLRNTDMSITSLVQTNLTNATLEGAKIYGISAWDIKKEGAVQKNLIVTQPGELEITVDSLEVGQFVYFILHNQNIREAIETITSKTVLILGRFTEERKKVLDAIKDNLRQKNYLPILFDFIGPQNQTIEETVILLARMSKFIIVDLTDPRCSPFEVAIISERSKTPIQPIILDTQEPFAMLPTRDPFLPIFKYSSIEALLTDMQGMVIEPAEQKVKELRGMTK